MNIKCKNLTLGYDESKLIIDKLDVFFPAQAVNVIIGPSGGGKSTLLRAIAALDDPLQGRIYYENNLHNELCPRTIRTKVGMIFQKPAVFEGTVYENLIFGLEQQRKEIKRENIEEILNKFGIPVNYLEKDARQLSVGEQQRICIIRALLPSPELFLLDEPTSALDPQNSKRVLHLIKKLKQDFDKSIIMVSHDIRETIEITDNIYFLAQGKVAYSGTIEDFRQTKAAYNPNGKNNNLLQKFLAGEYE